MMSLLFISSVFAALLAFHNAVARYLYALGREGLVPERLGHTHAKHLSPHIGSLSQSILALVVVLIFVITGQDPVLALFTWLTQLGTLAIIVLMALASFAVVAFFGRHRDLDSNVLRTTVAPIVGGVAMTAVAIYAASQFGLLIGNPESPLRWILPALIFVAAIAGIIAAVSLRTRSPELYAQMGRHRDIELMPGYVTVAGPGVRLPSQPSKRSAGRAESGTSSITAVKTITRIPETSECEMQCRLHTRDEFHPAERSDAAMGFTHALEIRSKGHKR